MKLSSRSILRGRDRRLPLVQLALLSLALVGLSTPALRAGVVEKAEACRQRSWLLLNLQARDLLDEKTASTVESGLPGTCVYEVVLVNDEGDRLAQRLLQATLQFDLWNNQYRVETVNGDAAFATLAEADSAWSDVRAMRLLPLDKMQPQERYRLQVRVSVQPLGAEEQARISRYVSQNSRSDRDEFALDVGALFRRLLGKGEAPQARTRFEGAWFRLEDLKEKP